MKYLIHITYPNGTTQQQVIPVPDRIPLPGSGDWVLESDDYADAMARTYAEAWVLEGIKIDIQPLDSQGLCPNCNGSKWIESLPPICDACGYRQPLDAKEPA